MNKELIDTHQLPLQCHTPQEWVSLALSDPLILLDDHAHLEKKAATNALHLLARWPDGDPPQRWVRVMGSVAQDEVSHLAQVNRILERRGGKISRSQKSSYAAKLRALVRREDSFANLVDRLLVSALIELRSCERFGLLAQDGSDPELQRLYSRLWASEHGHFKIFYELAAEIEEPGTLEERWQELLVQEAAIIQSQPAEPRLHSWAGDPSS